MNNKVEKMHSPNGEFKVLVRYVGQTSEPKIWTLSIKNIFFCPILFVVEDDVVCSVRFGSV